MYDEQTTDQAIQAFRNLSNDNIVKLKELNSRIQNHSGEWGKRMGGEQITENTFHESWMQRDPLITEFIDFAFETGFGVTYVWDDWNDDCATLFNSNSLTKFDDLDLRTALIMIGAAVRKDRGGGGTFVREFESGNFLRLINRLVALTADS